MSDPEGDSCSGTEIEESGVKRRQPCEAAGAAFRRHLADLAAEYDRLEAKCDALLEQNASLRSSLLAAGAWAAAGGRTEASGARRDGPMACELSATSPHQGDCVPAVEDEAFFGSGTTDTAEFSISMPESLELSLKADGGGDRVSLDKHPLRQLEGVPPSSPRSQKEMSPALHKKRFGSIHTRDTSRGLPNDTLHSRMSKRNLALDPKLAWWRVNVRLGCPKDGIVSAARVHETMIMLGDQEYSLSAWEELFKVLNDVCSSRNEGGTVGFNLMKRSGVSRGSKLNRTVSSIISNSTVSIQDTLLTGSGRRARLFRRWTASMEGIKTITLEFLMQALTASEGVTETLLCPMHAKMVRHLRNVLFASDANLLIAELTCVRVDDLCNSPPKDDWLDRIETPVALVVVLNGLAIGLQTDRTLENWGGWLIVDCSFTVFYVFEFILRLCVKGFRQAFVSRDCAWSWFDLVILTVALIDNGLSIFSTEDMAWIGFLRVVRMCRLVRLVRIFRLRIMRDLTLMVKGLASGLKTLFWAFVLLLALVYIIAVCMVSFVRDDDFEDQAGKPWQKAWPFRSVPAAMLVIFRCFTGDCADGWGMPLVQRLSYRYGVIFIGFYLLIFIIVTFGLFNLIMALYVENTMAAARVDEADNQRQAVLVAHKTRALLAKFCLAQAICEDPSTYGLPSHDRAQAVKKHLTTSDVSQLNVEDGDMVVTKEIFLLAIQDRGVQKLMDELDIPSDRAYLFDILDTKGAGCIQVTELVHGLLKVRGGPKKSDIVAVLLAVRSMQKQVEKIVQDVERSYSDEDRGRRHRGSPTGKPRRSEGGGGREAARHSTTSMDSRRCGETRKL